MTRRSYVQIDGVLYERGTEPPPEVHHVMPDIEPFKANTGAFIEGRRQWREHLKERNCDELGHSDIKARGEAWAKRRQAHKAKIAQAERVAPPVEVREDFRPVERSRLHAEVMNRLVGHENVPRKDVIRLTLQLAKRGTYGPRR